MPSAWANWRSGYDSPFSATAAACGSGPRRKGLPMTVQVVIHIANEDPILAELEQLPGAADTCLLALNPRARDNKDLRFLAPNVTRVVWPLSRVTFIEVLPVHDDEKIVGFVRE